jgi:hypothetical protein
MAGVMADIRFLHSIGVVQPVTCKAEALLRACALAGASDNSQHSDAEQQCRANLRHPGRDETQLPVLKSFIRSVLEAVATEKPYQKEHGLF